jgi:deoxyribodipyrimidine photolyase-related protein
MRHIHRETDGFRSLRSHIPSEPHPAATNEGVILREPKANEEPPYLESREADRALPPQTGWVSASDLTGATPSYLRATRPLPAAYWGAPSGLHCLDTVVQQVLREGWSHHITRLMVLSNLATLCGVSPRQLTDWFWFAYIDAYDWVVEPYISGAAYIHRMSNYCGHCQYDPRRSTGPGSCPVTALYWTFLDRNRDLLATNIRLAMPYRTLARKSPAELRALHQRAEEAIAHLASFPRPAYSAKPGEHATTASTQQGRLSGI